MPMVMEDLRSIPGVQFTEHALVRLTGAAQSTIDLTAMYWALLPDPSADNEKGFDEKDFMRMGAIAQDLFRRHAFLCVIGRGRELEWPRSGRDSDSQHHPVDLESRYARTAAQENGRAENRNVDRTLSAAAPCAMHPDWKVTSILLGG